MISSIEAYRYLRATMTECSQKAGWRSLLLRAYDDPPVAEPFTTPPTKDHLIVLVTKGTCNVEGLYRGKWQTANYGPGSLGMTAPGEEVTLRWRGGTSHSTLQFIRSFWASLQDCGRALRRSTPNRPHSS
jgi:AraC family transcriptional regulator